MKNISINEIPFQFVMPEIPGHDYPSLADTETLIPYNDWINGGRDVVLAALDNYVRETMSHHAASGATDADLPDLFRAIDAQLERLAARINDGLMPGSSGHKVTRAKIQYGEA